MNVGGLSFDVRRSPFNIHRRCGQGTNGQTGGCSANVLGWNPLRLGLLVDYTPEQQVAYEQLVLNNYEVDPTYFEEKYNMPVGERRQQPAPVGFPDGDDDPKKQQKNARPFFAPAPHDGAPLDW